MGFSVLELIFVLFCSVSRSQTAERNDISELKSVLMNLLTERAAEIIHQPPKEAKAATLGEKNELLGERQEYNDDLIRTYKFKHPVNQPPKEARTATLDERNQAFGEGQLYNDELITAYKLRYLVDQLKRKARRNNILRSNMNSQSTSTSSYSTQDGGTFESSSTTMPSTSQSTPPFGNNGNGKHYSREPFLTKTTTRRQNDSSERTLNDEELFTLYKHLARELRRYSGRQFLKHVAAGGHSSTDASSTTESSSTITVDQSTTEELTTTQYSTTRHHKKHGPLGAFVYGWLKMMPTGDLDD